jgi:hypothetical protein
MPIFIEAGGPLLLLGRLNCAAETDIDHSFRGHLVDVGRYLSHGMLPVRYSPVLNWKGWHK